MTSVAMQFAYETASKPFAVDNVALNHWSMVNYYGNQELALDLLLECQSFDLEYSILRLEIVGVVLARHQPHDDVAESVVKFVALRMVLLAMVLGFFQFSSVDTSMSQRIRQHLYGSHNRLSSCY